MSEADDDYIELNFKSKTTGEPLVYGICEWCHMSVPVVQLKGGVCNDCRE